MTEATSPKDAEGLFPRIAPRQLRVTLGLVGLLAALVASGIILGADPRLPILATLGAAALLAALAWKDWRFGVFAFFAWFLVEDLVRKFTGNPIILYAGKDIIYLAAFARFARDAWRHEAPILRNPVLVPLASLFVWALILSARAFVEHPLLPALGLRMMFLYVPLLYLGYALAKERARWRTFVLVQLGVAAVIAIVGLLQFALGLSFLNPADSGGLATELLHSFSSMESVPRPNSVFVHAGRFSAYLFSILFLASSLLVQGARLSRAQGSFAAACALIVLASLVAGGQRATIPLLALGFLALGVLTLVKPPPMRLKHPRWTLLGSGLAILLATLGLAWIISPSTFDLVMRFYGATFSPTGLPRTLGYLRYSIDGVLLSLGQTWLGHGTGTASLGKNYVYNVSWEARGLYWVEGGTATIAWEWGIVGLALWFALGGAVLWSIIRRLPSAIERGSHLFGAAVLVFAFVILLFWFHLAAQVYQNYVTQSILWLILGAFYATAPERAVAPHAGTSTRRIAIVSPFLDLRHGTERCILEQSKRLAAEGYEVHIYAQRLDDMPEAVRWTRGVSGAGCVFWHRVTPLRAFGALDYAWWFVANHWTRARDRRRGLRFDLVVTPGVNCLDADVIVVHIVFREYVARAGDSLLLRKNPVGAWPVLLHRRLYYAMIMLLERRVYTDPATRVGAVSPLTADEVRRHYGREDVGIVLNAVDLARFSPELREAARPEARRALGLEPDDIALLLVGNDWKKKGLDTLLEAMAILRDERVKLIVRGRDDTTLYAPLIARLELAGKVRFDPPTAEILPAYAAADVYVGPSVHDSFALPPLEAMACGIPIVTSAHNGGSCVVQDGHDGFVLRDPADAKTLAAVLARLVADPGLRARIGTAGARKARSLDWERSTDDLRALAGLPRRREASA